MNVDPFLDNKILDDKGNLRDTYINCLENYKVIIDGQPYYLIKTFYATNSRIDFLKTFSDQLDENLLEKVEIISDEITFNEYAALYDGSLNIVAVFNLKFGYFDFQENRIIFREPEEILLDYYKKSFKNPKKD